MVDEETKEVYQPIPPQTTARLWGIPKRRAQVIIGIIGLVLIALAIAVGVGVGIGRKGASSDRASPAVPSVLPHSAINVSNNEFLETVLHHRRPLLNLHRCHQLLFCLLYSMAL